MARKTALKDVSTLDPKKVQEAINEFWLDRVKETLTKQWFDLSKKSTKKVWDTIDTPKTFDDIYSQREEYIESYVWALGESFDEATWVQLEKYKQAKEDATRDIEYYRADFDKITSRRNQDYFTWIALQNKEFRKSLDYVANLWAKTMWALQWFWKSRIVEATEWKIESEARYKLDFERGAEDLAIWKERAEARYKVWELRLSEWQAQYEKSRDIEKKVWAIEAAWAATRYYDELITGKTLWEDEAAKRRQDITGGWTGIEKIFSY